MPSLPSFSLDNPPPINNTQADDQYRLLWMNVLLRASEEARGINCIVDRTCTKDQLQREAREWLTHDSHCLFLVCEWAGVEYRKTLDHFRRVYEEGGGNPEADGAGGL